MTSTVVYFCRHGIREDWGNREWKRTALRPHDPQLSPEGEMQAQALAAEFIKINDYHPIHHILCSPLLRTLQTANAIAQALDLSIKIEYGAMEWSTNQMITPLSIEELANKFPRVDVTYFSTLLTLPGPESKQKIHERCQESIQNILTRFRGSNIIIITHAAPLICLVRGLAHDPKMLVRTGTCSVTKLSSNMSSSGDNEAPEDWMVEMNGYCGHLLHGEEFHWTFG